MKHLEEGENRKLDAAIKQTSALGIKDIERYLFAYHHRYRLYRLKGGKRSLKDLLDAGF